jgi:hypothetical protein
VSSAARRHGQHPAAARRQPSTSLSLTLIISPARRLVAHLDGGVDSRARRQLVRSRAPAAASHHNFARRARHHYDPNELYGRRRPSIATLSLTPVLLQSRSRSRSPAPAGRRPASATTAGRVAPLDLIQVQLSSCYWRRCPRRRAQCRAERWNNSDNDNYTRDGR